MGHASDGNGRDVPGRLTATAPVERARRMVAEVAFDVATTPEGRAAGLSVEVWPAEGVWLRLRSGHELRVRVDARPEGATIEWSRVDPLPHEPRRSDGGLGPARSMSEEDLRRFVAQWLAWCTRVA